MREPATPCPPNTFDEDAARPDVRRATPVVPEHVRLEVRIDPTAHTVSGHVEHTVRAIGDGVARITLDAADLVVSAASQRGEAAAFLQHAYGVDVELPGTLAAGERTTIRVDFDATPTAGLYFIDGQAWTQGAMEDHHHWFPCFDAPQHMVTTEVVARVPDGLRALSNGVPLAEGEPAGGGWTRWHWRHDTPHALYLLTLVVDDSVEVACEGEVPLFHYVPEGREHDARVLFERMPEMLAYFGEATGRAYPYPRYGHAFLRRFMWGGMENTTLTSLTDEVLVAAEYRDETDVERLFAHELAHQWFGDLIAPRGWPQIWLNESFATYFEVLCMGALEGPDDEARRLLANRDSYLAEARGRYARAVVTRRYAHPYVLFDRHAYEKGCLVLHTLRDQLGEGAWWRGVRLYVERCAGTAAETDQLRRAFEDATGADLAPFFEELVYGVAHPAVRVDWRWVAEVGLEVTLARTDDTAQTLQVELAWASGDAILRRRVSVAPGTRTLVLPASSPPTWVALDPDMACLLEVDEGRESEAVLLARLETDVPRMLRVRTVRVLAGRGSARVTARLAELLAGDGSRLVRIEAAKALGAHRSDDARYALLGAVQSEAHWRVRAAAAAALGVGADGALVERFDTLLDAESSPKVRAGLLAGLGGIQHERARAVLWDWIDIDSPRSIVASAAVSALGAQEHADVAEELLARAETHHPRDVRRAALAGIGRLAKSETLDKALRKRLREALEARLGDPLFHARLSAIVALKKLGDPASRAALKRAHGAESFALVRRYIREALGALA